MKISLNMIVKNEEMLLPRALESMKNVVDEMIIVDTGSTDKTKEIAKSFGAKVFDFAWIDDFAAARNHALDHSTGDWILWLDADEWMDKENGEKLLNLKQSLTDAYDGYSFETHELATHIDVDPFITGTKKNIRLFRKRPEYRWKFPIMEVISPLNIKHEQLKEFPISFQKHRFESEEQLRAQRIKYLGILLNNYDACKDDPRFPFQIGSEYHYLGKYTDAIPYLLEAITQLIFTYDPKNLINADVFLNQMLNEKTTHTLLETIKKINTSGTSLFQTSLLWLAQSLLFSGKLAMAHYTLQNAKILFPKNCLLIHFESGINLHIGNKNLAKILFQKMIDLSISTPATELLINPLYARVIGRYNLAEIEESEHHFQKAEELWKLALSEFPNSVPALKGLALFYHKQKRFNDFENSVHQLEKLSDGIEIANQLKKLELE